MSNSHTKETIGSVNLKYVYLPLIITFVVMGVLIVLGYYQSQAQEVLIHNCFVNHGILIDYDRDGRYSCMIKESME